MEELVYLIWAQKVLGGTQALTKALTQFNSAEALYSAVCTDLKSINCLSRIKQDKLFSYSLEEAKKVLALCLQKGYELIDYKSAKYPEELLSLIDRPALLFCIGNTDILSASHKVSVVGTRKPSLSGRSTAYKAGLYLSSAGVCTVSGAAFGIDNCAHEGAMLGISGTIAVLGCGLESPYMHKIPMIEERMKNNGVMITELLPDENPTRFTFPKRNRLISGLSEKCLVVECGEKSGALITAELTQKQGKELYCISSSVLDSPGIRKLESEGVRGISTISEMYENGIINNEFMKMPLKSNGLEGRAFLLENSVTSGEYNGYHHGEPENLPKQTNKKTKAVKIDSEPGLSDNFPSEIAEVTADYSGLSSDEICILQCLSDKPVYPDEICDKTGFDIVSVTVALTSLELEGLIKLNPGNTVTLN